MTSPRIPSGREIRTARELRGWTQAMLIEALVQQGYHRRIVKSTYSTIESGHRPIPRLMLGPLLRALPELSELPAADEDEPERALAS